MDAQQKLVGVATNESTYILGMIDGKLNLLQTLNSSSYELEFSRDGQYLLTTGDGKISVYWNQVF